MRERCPRWDSNPHWRDFEARASAGWATGAEPTSVTSPAVRKIVRRLTTLTVVSAALAAWRRKKVDENERRFFGKP